MALYWPEAKVALDIVDDPNRRPFEGDDDYTVIRVTCAELTNYDSFRKITDHLAKLLGKQIPVDPEWCKRNQSLHALMSKLMTSTGDEASLDSIVRAAENYVDSLDCDDLFGEGYPFGDETPVDDDLQSIQILASSEAEGRIMSAAARLDGRHVRKVDVWEGPVPEGSFEDLSNGMRMSTPEYFFFRKANQLPFARAVQLGTELCGKYRTVITQYNAEEDYDYLTHARTSVERIRTYLRGARGSKEFKRARRVLESVINDAGSPMNCYLYLRLCLSRSHGGYGLRKPKLTCVFDSDDGLMPAPEGVFLAYDLVWPKEKVALQYAGSKLPGKRQRKALEMGGMRVVYATNDDLVDDKSFDRLARKVAKFLDAPVPDDNDQWSNARKRLSRQVEVPAYEHMLLTLSDIEEHLYNED